MEYNRDYETTIAQLQADLTEFKHASQELERELEAELDESSRRIEELTDKLAHAESTSDQWKTKYTSLQVEASDREERLALQLKQANEQKVRVEQRLRNIEMDNDDLEQSERVTKLNMEQLEMQNSQLLETLAVLEAEKAHALEELQRTRDLLRDTTEELENTQRRIKVSKNTHRTMPRSSSLRRVAGIIDQVECLEGQVEEARKRISAANGTQPSKRDLQVSKPKINGTRRAFSERGRKIEDNIPDLRNLHISSRNISPGAGHGKPLN